VLSRVPVEGVEVLSDREEVGERYAAWLGLRLGLGLGLGLGFGLGFGLGLGEEVGGRRAAIDGRIRTGHHLDHVARLVRVRG
jgi:hypothetical protein